MSDQDFILIEREVHALSTAREADEAAHAADEGVDIPGTAARYSWDASALLRQHGQSLIDLADRYVFQARRYEKAQRTEDRTGREYKGNGEAA